MDKIPSKGEITMARSKPPKMERLFLGEITSQDIQNALKDAADCKSRKLSGSKVVIIDSKKSNVMSKSGAFDYISNAPATFRCELYGYMDLGALLLSSAIKSGNRYAHDNVKFNFNLNSSVSITRNDDYEANRIVAIKEYSSRLTRNCKLSAAKIAELINSNATLDYKAGLEAGFFDKNVKPVDKTSTPKTVEGNTGKTGILVGDKSTVPPMKTEPSKETISATTKGEEIPGYDNIKVVEEKPTK